jgi:hypothetical protein
VTLECGRAFRRASCEGLDTPKKRLLACAPDASFLVLDNGQSVTLASASWKVPWWMAMLAPAPRIAWARAASSGAICTGDMNQRGS